MQLGEEAAGGVVQVGEEAAAAVEFGIKFGGVVQLGGRRRRCAGAGGVVQVGVELAAPGGVYLPQPVLYVAASRVGPREGVKFGIKPPNAEFFFFKF